MNFAKAYLQKEGTTTMKCASSAESDVSDQAVALFIAVISQIARRCYLLVGWLLRAATIAFTTKHWVIQTRTWFGKGTFQACKRRNVVHMFLKTSCQSVIDPQCFHEYVCLVSLQTDSREWQSLAYPTPRPSQRLPLVAKLILSRLTFVFLNQVNSDSLCWR